MLQPLSSTNRVLLIGLSSKTSPSSICRCCRRWTIRPRLMGVPGVANVANWGRRERQLQVQVDPKRLAEKNVSLIQIVKTTGNSLWYSPLTFSEASVGGTGGVHRDANQRLGVRHVLPISVAGATSPRFPWKVRRSRLETWPRSSKTTTAHRRRPER
jgi:hypothetical protein